jgi:chemotaxis protein MotC
MKMSGRLCGAALAALCLAGPAPAADGKEATKLEPYQMVRSLQLVQDRIAGGDHAALPMQRKLLEMIDQRFREANSEDFTDERNYEALLLYAMSGGNPTTMDVLLAKLHLDETDRALGTGILGYLRGDLPAARAALASVDPWTLTPELGAFFALVKGSIIVSEEPKPALQLFDEARLLSPGTLVEEAALRRTIALGPRALDAPHFLSAAGQYIRRYLRSPYASQFVDAMVAGIVTFHETVDLNELDTIIAGMDPEQRKVLYLRLARRALIDGIPGLAEYASTKADAINVDGVEPSSDPRSLLYSSLANLTSETVDQVLPQLKAIDRSRLSESDRKLLDAAEAIATDVTSRPEQPANAGAVEPAVEPKDGELTEGAAADDGLPEAEPLDALQAAEPAPPAPTEAHALPAPKQTDTQASAPVTEGQSQAKATDSAPAGVADGGTGSPAPTEASAHPLPPSEPSPASEHPTDATADAAADVTTVDADQTSAIVTDARKKLDEIDKLLKETSQ